MTARVFVHPRCWAGPASGAFAATLEERGYDLMKWKVGPLGTHHRRELVKEIAQNLAFTTYERCDGSTFQHRMGTPAPAPEGAA